MKSKLKVIIKKGKENKIVKGVLWAFIGVFISKGFLLITFFILAKFLSVEEYGKVGVLRSYINSFALFSLASFGVTATKYLALYHKEDKEKASQIYSFTRLIVFILAIVMLLLSILFSRTITQYITGSHNLHKEIIISSITIFFVALNGLQTGALSGLEKFKLISYINIFNGLLTLPVVLFGAYYNGVTGVVIGLLIINFSIWGFSAYYLDKSLQKEAIYFTFDKFKQNIKIVKEFTLPAFLSGLMIAPVILVSNSLIINNHQNGFEELGIYSAAFNYLSISTALLGIIGQVFYPFAMRNFKSKNKAFEFTNIILPLTIGVFIAFPLLIFPEFFMGIYGEKYMSKASQTTLVYIAIIIIIIAQRQGIARNFAAGNYMWWSILSNLFWGIAAISFTYLLMEQGAVGRAKAFFFAYLLNTIVFMPFYLVKKLIPYELVFNKYNLFIIIFIFTILFLPINSLFLKFVEYSLMSMFIIYLIYLMIKKYINP